MSCFATLDEIDGATNRTCVIVFGSSPGRLSRTHCFANASMVAETSAGSKDPDRAPTDAPDLRHHVAQNIEKGLMQEQRLEVVHNVENKVAHHAGSKKKHWANSPYCNRKKKRCQNQNTARKESRQTRNEKSNTEAQSDDNIENKKTSKTHRRIKMCHQLEWKLEKKDEMRVLQQRIARKL